MKTRITLRWSSFDSLYSTYEFDSTEEADAFVRGLDIAIRMGGSYEILEKQIGSHADRCCVTWSAPYSPTETRLREIKVGEFLERVAA